MVANVSGGSSVVGDVTNAFDSTAENVYVSDEIIPKATWKRNFFNFNNVQIIKNLIFKF